MGAHAFASGPGRYVKLAAALFGAIASSVVALGITGGHINPAEWVNIGIAAVGAVQVWYVTETSDNPNGKAVIAAVAAGLVALQSFVSGGGSISLAEWMQVGLAALTATGIWAAPSLAPTKNSGPRYLAAPSENPVTKGYVETGSATVDIKADASQVKNQVAAATNYIQNRYGAVTPPTITVTKEDRPDGPPSEWPPPAPRPKDLP